MLELIPPFIVHLKHMWEQQTGVSLEKCSWCSCHAIPWGWGVGWGTPAPAHAGGEGRMPWGLCTLPLPANPLAAPKPRPRYKPKMRYCATAPLILQFHALPASKGGRPPSRRRDGKQRRVEQDIGVTAIICLKTVRVPS